MSRTGIVQEALFKVHARVHEEAEGHPGGGPPTGVTRMLVCHTQAGSIIGKCVAGSPVACAAAQHLHSCPVRLMHAIWCWGDDTLKSEHWLLCGGGLCGSCWWCMSAVSATCTEVQRVHLGLPCVIVQKDLV